jgi:hypothetical protein
LERGAPPKALGDSFGDATGDALTLPSWLWAELLVYCLLLYVAAAEQLSLCC